MSEAITENSIKGIFSSPVIRLKRLAKARERAKARMKAKIAFMCLRTKRMTRAKSSKAISRKKLIPFTPFS